MSYSDYPITLMLDTLRALRYSSKTMTPEFSPLSDEDFENFLLQSEHQARENDELARLNTEVLDLLFVAIEKTNTPALIPKDTEDHEEAFMRLFSAIVDQEFPDSHELSPHEMRTAHLIANSEWEREEYSTSIIMQAILDFHFSDVPMEEKMGIKRRSSALFIALEDLRAEKWIPVLNAAIGGESFDYRRPVDIFLLRQIEEEISTGNPMNAPLSELAEALQKTFIYADDDIDLQTEKEIVLNKLRDTVADKIIQKATPEKLYEQLDTCLRQSPLLYAQRHDIIALCDKYIDALRSL